MTREPDPTGPGVLTAGSRSARALLPPDDGTPAAARRLVSTVLLAWGCGEQVEILELATSELVSNAVRYAGDFGDLELEIAADAVTICLWVADGAPVTQHLRDLTSNGGHDRPADPAASSGRLGLRLVTRVADRWGVDEYLLGKRVWLELARQQNG